MKIRPKGPGMLPLPDAWGTQLCILSLICQGSAFGLWVHPSDSGFLTYTCSLQGEGVSGVGCSELQKVVGPANHTTSKENTPSQRAESSRGQCTKGVSWSRLLHAPERIAGGNDWVLEGMRLFMF